jgi:hypothetical protein
MHTGDPLWMKVLLGLHIAAGFGAFVLAPIPLATAKGGRAHKRWGMVYLWSMGVVAATALPMAFYRPVLFLALVAIFSFYLAFAGYRVLRLKELARGGHPQAIDWIAAIVTTVDGAALLWLGVFRPAAIQVIPVVGVAFGVIGMLSGLKSIRMFVWKPEEKMFWWYTHLQSFMGSYIAAWSAFSAVTLSQVFGNKWYVWLWPTMIGVPAITMVTIYYKRKFAPKARPAVA